MKQERMHICKSFGSYMLYCSFSLQGFLLMQKAFFTTFFQLMKYCYLSFQGIFRNNVSFHLCIHLSCFVQFWNWSLHAVNHETICRLFFFLVVVFGVFWFFIFVCLGLVWWDRNSHLAAEEKENIVLISHFNKLSGRACIRLSFIC